MVWQKITSRLPGLRRRDESASKDQAVVKIFRKRYAHFRRLLEANAALAELMADMEVKLGGNSLFGQLYVHRSSQKALFLARRMAVSLIKMQPGKHAGLEKAVDRAEGSIRLLLGEDAECAGICNLLTIPLSNIDLSMVDWVGGKCANLGEMQSQAGIPVPRGFAVTVAAFQRFMEHESLGERIQTLLGTIETTDRQNFPLALQEIQTLIQTAPLPESLTQAFDLALAQAFGEDNVRLAVRSSAQVEDGDKSFAGQFLTELGVVRAGFSDSYRNVVASLFTPSATLYRMHQGIPLSASAMAVACLEMVDAACSGVAYSHDPVNLMQDTVIINGVWGLGRYAVDGLVEPDLWVFTREEEPELVRSRPGTKDRQLVVGPEGEILDQTVSANDQRRFCLSDEEARELARLVMRLERHYGGYQDIEWSKTRDNRLVFLQSRPLDTRSGSDNVPKPPLLEHYPLLIEGGVAAYPGVGYGPVVKPQTPEDLFNFPEGGVLVAAHSSATYAAVMDKAQAIITETGGITGHMATICREFRVPTILNMPEVMRLLEAGTNVTVDAFSGRVYRGKAEELLPLRLALESVRLQDTPVYRMLQKVARVILPLNLTDPASAGFSPENCKTLHDVMRYTHELSYQAMFAISDSAAEAGGVALKLKAPLPIDLYLIDLDNGTTAKPHAKSVLPEEIVCAPLEALLGGMLRPDVMFRRPRPVNMGGFLSVMGQQMGNPQGASAERFGDRSYAIVSDRYMNFSSRVGYHYSVLDAYCGKTDSKNYISFSFQGGAAGEVRRVRRIRAIAMVLEKLGFSVIVRGDMVTARFQKYPQAIIEDRLDQLGRLLQVTRQMDMLMTSDAAVSQFKEDFMKGIYR